MKQRLWIGTLALLGATQCLAGAGRPSPEVRVLFPADRSVVQSGKFSLLCTMAGSEPRDAPLPRLRVDGKPRRWEPYEPPVLLARLDLAPGRHKIAVGSQTIAIFVGSGELPAEVHDWPVVRMHLGRNEACADCATCHRTTTQGGRVAVLAPNEPAACLPCHSSVDFEAKHFHPQPPLAACHLCHALHGASTPSLLKAPVKTLCTQCHD